jgi:hypothetical protein
MYPKNATSKEGSSAANSSTVKLVKSNTSVVWVGRSQYRSMSGPSFRGGHSITQIVMNSNVLILLANSEASKFRLAFHFFEGTEAWKKLGGNLGFIVVK